MDAEISRERELGRERGGGILGGGGEVFIGGKHRVYPVYLWDGQNTKNNVYRIFVCT